jgi:hypothetical protein
MARSDPQKEPHVDEKLIAGLAGERFAVLPASDGHSTPAS